MRPGGMLRHGLGWHKRAAQATTSLPGRIDNPTATLPPSIGPSGIATADPSGAITTAQAVSGLTTITETQTLARSTGGVQTTFTTEIISTITNSADYASFTSAEAASSSSSTAHSTSSSTTSAAVTSSPAAKSSNSNLSTLIPAIVVPVVVVSLASLGLFWFFMRRRHRKELQSQPEFVMTGKGEKLSSRSSSSQSTAAKTTMPEKKSPIVVQKEVPSTISPPTVASEWPSGQVSAVLPLAHKVPNTESRNHSLDRERKLTASSPYRNVRPQNQGPRPATAGRPGPPSQGRDQGAYRNRSNSTPGQRGPPPQSRSGPNPAFRTTQSPVLRSAPSPVPQHPTSKHSQQPPPSAFRMRDPSPTMNHSNRAQAPPRVDAPPPGAFNGASSISQYSPIVKDGPDAPKPAPGKRAPPPIDTAGSRATTKSPNTTSPLDHGLTEENLRIARLANSSRLGHSHTPAEPSPSPKLPPPATRSQLIPREFTKEPQDRFFGSNTPTGPGLASHQTSRRASIVSDADDYEDIDAKSDVSSLNEFERFDFGTDVASGRGSAAGNSLTYFAARNTPDNSERGSAFGTGIVHERW